MSETWQACTGGYFSHHQILRLCQFNQYFQQIGLSSTSLTNNGCIYAHQHLSPEGPQLRGLHQSFQGDRSHPRDKVARVRSLSVHHLIRHCYGFWLVIYFPKDREATEEDVCIIFRQELMFNVHFEPAPSVHLCGSHETLLTACRT